MSFLNSYKLLSEHQLQEAELESFASQCISELNQQKPFVVYLLGEMGVGKTTLTRFMVRALGLDRRVPIQSPTFTYINEYILKGGSYAHCDFYRIENNSSIEDLLSYREFDGVFIEWPFQSCDTPEATHVLDIHLKDDKRIYRWYKKNS